MRKKTVAEKFADYEQLKKAAHKRVDTLTRAQLKKFVTSNGPVKLQPCITKGTTQ
jgi:hypothetical protein